MIQGNMAVMQELLMFHDIEQNYDIPNTNTNVILTKFSSLAVLEVVKMTTSSAARDENFFKMTTYAFQRNYSRCHILALSHPYSDLDNVIAPWVIPDEGVSTWDIPLHIHMPW